MCVYSFGICLETDKNHVQFQQGQSMVFVQRSEPHLITEFGVLSNWQAWQCKMNAECEHILHISSAKQFTHSNVQHDTRYWLTRSTQT